MIRDVLKCKISPAIIFMYLFSAKVVDLNNSPRQKQPIKIPPKNKQKLCWSRSQQSRLFLNRIQDLFLKIKLCCGPGTQRSLAGFVFAPLFPGLTCQSNCAASVASLGILETAGSFGGLNYREAGIIMTLVCGDEEGKVRRWCWGEKGQRVGQTSSAGCFLAALEIKEEFRRFSSLVRIKLLIIDVRKLELLKCST